MVYAHCHAIVYHLLHLAFWQRVVPPHELGLEDGIDGLRLEIRLVVCEEEVVSVPVPRLAFGVRGGSLGALGAHCGNERAHCGFSVALGGWYTDGLEGCLFFTLLLSRVPVVFNLRWRRRWGEQDNDGGGSTV